MTPTLSTQREEQTWTKPKVDEKVIFLPDWSPTAACRDQNPKAAVTLPPQFSSILRSTQTSAPPTHLSLIFFPFRDLG